MIRKYFMEHEKREIVKMYLNGKNQVEIANHFNTYNTSIKRILTSQNVKILNYSERNRKIEPTFFNNWSNPNIQYWLGVIASDGCIHKGSLIIQTIDKEWMEDYRNFLNPEININITQPRKGNLLYRVAIRSEGLDKELEKYGIIAKKSLKLDWKYPITSDFIRGYFDGDGCVSHRKDNNIIITISGGYLPILEKFKIFLFQNNINCTITSSSVNKKNIFYTLNINSYNDKIKFYHLIYDNSNYKLKRKYEKFSNIFQYNFIGTTSKRKVKIEINNQTLKFESIASAAKHLNIKSNRLSFILKNNLQPIENVIINYL